MSFSWRDHQPIYRQIRARIIESILDREEDSSAPLPSVRVLASELGVNPLTVSKAYQDLQFAGFVEAQRGLGMFVAPGARARLKETERATFLRHDWPDIRRRIERLDIAIADLLDDARLEEAE